MSALPKRVKVGPHRYRVSTDPVELASTSVEENAHLIGHCCEQRQRILVSPDQTRGAQTDVLLHEALHAVFFQTGLAGELGEDRTESAIVRLTPALLDLIRRNPTMLAFLLDPGST